MKLATAKLLLALGAVVLLPACATVAPPQTPSLQLPKPPSDLRATRKGDTVTLTWTIPALTTDRQRLRSLGPTRVCRGINPPATSCTTPVGQAPPPQDFEAIRKSAGQKVPVSYKDTLPNQLERDNPLGSVTYAVEVLNADGRGAGLSNPVSVQLAPAAPPPQDFSAHATAEGVVLTWTKPSLPTVEPPLSYVFRVYRRQKGNQQQIVIGEVSAGNGPSFTLTDPGIEWEQTYDYFADTVTVIAQEGRPDVRIEGDDTPPIEVFAHDIFPPAVPSGLQAVFSGPGQEPFVDLIWAPVTDVDLAGYNVYRHEEGAALEKLNSEPLKTPAYRDKNVASGKQYLYSVSAVDVRGNESARSEEASERVP